MRRVHLRSSLVLLAISVGAILLGGVQLFTSQQQLPIGSSYSAQPDGVRGLYEWTQSLGAQPVRLDTTGSDTSPSLVLVVEPESLFSEADRARLDDVPRRGGTLALAGEGFWLQALLGRFGVALEPTRAVTTAFQPGATAGLPVAARYRVRPVTNATPVLVSSDGSWLAMREPYLNGTLLVLTTSEPLTNAGLRDDGVARFVYQTLGLEDVAGRSLGFEEAHHSYAPASAASPASLSSLVYETAVGRALLYAGLVIFVWLLLSGRRLGPPLPARGATQAGRTMFEHVQTLAGLYRRAGQLEAARDAFARHYRRLSGTHSALRDSLPSIEAARNESALLAAVARADDATRTLTGSDL